MDGDGMTKPKKAAVDVAAELARVARALNVADLDDHPGGGRLAAMVRSMATDGRGREDPIREIFGRLGDKWSTLLLLLLGAGPFRHATLRRLVGAVTDEARISQRMLTLRLRSLERDGLVERRVTPTVPPQVEYALTDLGRDLLAQVEGLMAWVRRHHDAVLAARARFHDSGPED